MAAGYVNSLELDHINGDSADNCRGNLRALCVGCHRARHGRRDAPHVAALLDGFRGGQ